MIRASQSSDHGEPWRWLGGNKTEPPGAVARSAFTFEAPATGVAGGGSSPRYLLHPAFHVCSYAGMYTRIVALTIKGSVRIFTRELPEFPNHVREVVRVSWLAFRARVASSSAASFRPTVK